MKKDSPRPVPASPVMPGRGPRAFVRAAAALLALTSPLAAQFGPAPKPVTVVQGGTVHVGNGDVLEGGTVILRGSRIESVGKGLAIPEGAALIDATGRHVYPGLIDVESNVLLDSLRRHGGEGSAATSVVDALDPFESDLVQEVLRGGVTTVGAVSRRGLFDGRIAVLKLEPRGRLSDLVIRRDVAVASTFGLSGSRPSMRLREWKTFAEQLEATKKYAEAWDEYKEKLEEYRKELEKARKEAESKGPEARKPEGAPPPAPESKEPKASDREEGPAPGRRPGPRRRPGGSLTEFLRRLAGDRAPADADLHHHDEDGHEGDDEEDDHGRTPWLRDGVSYADGPPGGGPPPAPGGEKKEEGPKKPGRPAREPQKEVLREVLEGRLPLNVYADHAADLENLIELARRYRFRFVVTGGREADHVAEALVAARAPVVVAQPHDLSSENLSTAAALDAAGVSVAITTAGRTGAATRHLSLSAAAAVAGGMEREHALAAITSRAAALLGVDDRVGTLEAGKDADLVITRGELFSSTAVVERVFVGGAAVVVR